MHIYNIDNRLKDQNALDIKSQSSGQYVLIQCCLYKDGIEQRKLQYSKFMQDKTILVYSCGYKITLLILNNYSSEILLYIFESIIELQIDLDCIIVTSKNVIIKIDDLNVKYKLSFLQINYLILKIVFEKAKQVEQALNDVKFEWMYCIIDKIFEQHRLFYKENMLGDYQNLILLPVSKQQQITFKFKQSL
ncbi:hypothetical protein pb186bvf_021011 [Paramecium bursaria]